MLKFQHADLTVVQPADKSAGMWDSEKANQLSRRERQVVDIVMKHGRVEDGTPEGFEDACAESLC
ncbi:MAG: hypothetical protein NTV80_15590 [Verrucomicrobia bacterium]|nr:hypothetical protein [Verrucomicrobiota bacterium]